ncbi:MAG: GNAT family N-acetyltransferase [Methanomassiliicoccales archaeon]|jgi:ribosomal protein S18 acetylase RimI-like enzyme|nr:GNAT family N-acetyltransferase [Methanomassiliicoccales archaeon]
MGLDRFLSLSFRSFQKHDLPVLAKISRDNMAHIIQSAWGVEWKDELLIDTLCDEDARTEILEIDGKIIGYYCIFIEDKRVFIASIQVARAYQHRGYGAAMIKRIETIASRINAERVELWVQSNNEEAIGFYEHMGFRIVARQRNNLLMRKFIRPLVRRDQRQFRRDFDGRTPA